MAAARAALELGPFAVDPPVVLAPMAGVTNIAFRRLCREHGAGLYVSEMITSRALVERSPETMLMIAFEPAERPRSLQLYGVDPDTVAAAVRMVATEDLADHVDLNFGCPVPKVTRRGGGAALPYKRALFAEIVGAAVRAADPHGIPVTVKFRIGIDDEHPTYLDAGRIAAASGVAAVALHARTAAQRYSGRADWSAIGKLRDTVPARVPVLGNGDIFAAADAVRMMRQTGCDGVVIGRGCLGRPWLFAELEAALRGLPVPPAPNLGEVAAVLRRHAELIRDHLGEYRASREVRKHIAWYLRGFPVAGELRKALALVASLAELDGLLTQLPAGTPYPAEAAGPRGRQGSPGKVVLPAGWLDDPDDRTVPAGAELPHSGG